MSLGLMQRRLLLASLSASALPLRRAVAATKINAVIAVIPTSQGNGPIFYYMRQHKLFEKYAEKFGYDLTTTFLKFETGPQITEGMAAGDIDFGIAGYLPMATIMASGLPILPISNIEGSEHWLMVRNGSPIHSVEDLVKYKAKIATAVGSTSQYVLLELFRVYFDKTPQELGVTVVPMAPSIGITFPEGIDAILYWEALPEIAEEKVGAVKLVNEYGETGPAYRGGTGLNLFERHPEIWNKSLYAPESLVAYRVFATTRKALVEQQPKLVTAFLLAQQEAVKILSKDWNLVYDLNKESWPIPYDKAAEFLRVDVILGRRDWIWLTESDLKPVVWGSYWAYANGLLRRPVTWDIAEAYLKPIADLAQDAYKRSGTYPELAVMIQPAKLGDKPVPDLRGYPVWMMDKWTAPMPAQLSRDVSK